jgi:pseudaminic acid cytidylyltransferase
MRIAIIPARGGSKRIPRKNIRNFLGKPIIAYVIQTALDSGLFDEVMVSTEDDEIAQVAIQYGAWVPFRRSLANANDYASTADVLLEVLATYAEHGQTFTYGCCLYPTAPLITTELLQAGWERLSAGGYDVVFPVLPHSHPIQRALKMENDKVSMIWPENALVRSQDLPATYHDAGQFYWFTTASLQQKKQLLTDNASALIIGAMQAQDIDNLDDWQTAELKYQRLQSQQAGG